MWSTIELSSTAVSRDSTSTCSSAMERRNTDINERTRSLMSVLVELERFCRHRQRWRPQWIATQFIERIFLIWTKQRRALHNIVLRTMLFGPDHWCTLEIICLLRRQIISKVSTAPQVQWKHQFHSFNIKDVERMKPPPHRCIFDASMRQPTKSAVWGFLFSYHLRWYENKTIQRETRKTIIMVCLRLLVSSPRRGEALWMVSNDWLPRATVNRCSRSSIVALKHLSPPSNTWWRHDIHKAFLRLYECFSSSQNTSSSMLSIEEECVLGSKCLCATAFSGCVNGFFEASDTQTTKNTRADNIGNVVARAHLQSIALIEDERVLVQQVVLRPSRALRPCSTSFGSWTCTCWWPAWPSSWIVDSRRRNACVRLKAPLLQERHMHLSFRPLPSQLWV